MLNMYKIFNLKVLETFDYNLQKLSDTTFRPCHLSLFLVCHF